VEEGHDADPDISLLQLQRARNTQTPHSHVQVREGDGQRLSCPSRGMENEGQSISLRQCYPMWLQGLRVPFDVEKFVPRRATLTTSK
jgi:hypothetical protein